ncbi:sensor domain-containing diguanylate cyclase [Thalassotalea psychrophila]|uniref:diguanylate cyclase n=1 Tax=Thalassotalea psychrophila TaxID=3065647 RepID=A0ABY9TR55_9GAMM|nr:sensor domain-containing diguanylate cyclase [Colwelliaceae bacterium SQ149]
MSNNKLFYMPLIAVLLLFSLAFPFFTASLHEITSDVIKTSLAAQLESLETNNYDELLNKEPQVLQNYVLSQSFNKNDQRLTIIDINGVVKADSSHKTVEQMHSHAHEPEFLQAVKHDQGSAIHFSEALQIDMLYVAKKAVLANGTYIIRIATPLASITTVEQRVLLLLGVLILTTIILIGLVSFNLNKRIRIHLMERQKSYEKILLGKNREFELLNQLANYLAACKSFDEAEKIITNLVPKIIGDVSGSLSIIKDSRNLVEPKINWSKGNNAQVPFAPSECWALRKGHYHLTTESDITIRCEHTAEEQDQMLCIPLSAHGNTIGVVHFDIQGKLSDDRMMLVKSVVEHLGLAMANLKLQYQLRSQALKDPLTGLFNRRFLDENLELEISRANRHGKSLSLLMVDFDHFKRFNDNFGHDAGDYVLKEISTLLDKNTRKENSVCRVGGEEIAILLPETSKEDAALLADKLCSLVRKLHLKHRGQSLGKLSISIGISSFPDDADTAFDLYKHADSCLYKAKANGRDQYSIEVQEYSDKKSQNESNAVELSSIVNGN